MATEEKKPKKKFSRRKFLQRGAIVFGGTIVATIAAKGPIRRFIAQTAENTDTPLLISSLEPTFWFEIMPDNTIQYKSTKLEMGQGVFTGLAMLAAEELEVSLEQIKVVHANTANGVEDSLGTGGSNSTLTLYKPIREVAATMRETMECAGYCHQGRKWSNDLGQSQSHLLRNFHFYQRMESLRNPCLKTYLFL